MLHGAVSELAGYMLQSQVRKTSVTDYNDFVPAKDEMWVDRIKKALAKFQYSSRQAFQNDVQQIVTNARAYNYNKAAVCAYPGALLHEVARVGVKKECYEWALCYKVASIS